MSNSYRLGTVHTNYLSNEELKSEFRNFKLKVINGEQKFAIKDFNIEKFKDKLYFISDRFPGDIISGSLALNLFGLINRDSNDIDILIEDPSRFSNYTKDGYDDEISTPNRLGYIAFRYKRGIFSSEKNYVVDFFHNDYDASFMTFKFANKEIKIHNPLEIIDYKLRMATSSKSLQSTSRKHNEDLTQIFGQMSWQLL